MRNNNNSEFIEKSSSRCYSLFLKKGVKLTLSKVSQGNCNMILSFIALFIIMYFKANFCFYFGKRLCVGDGTGVKREDQPNLNGDKLLCVYITHDATQPLSDITGGACFLH